MLSFRKQLLTALALCLIMAWPVVAAPAPGEAPAGTFEKYLPDTCDGVIKINVRQLLDSELMKKAGLDKLLATEDAQKGVKLLGFDPLKDVESVVIANDKSKSGDEPFFIIQGKFDTAKLTALVDKAVEEKKETLKVHKTEHGKVYEVTKLDEIVKQLPAAAAAPVGGNLKDKSVFVTFADKGNVILTSSKEAAETSLAKAAGKQMTKLGNKELVGLLGKIDPKQTIAVALPNPLPEEKLKSITGGVTVTADVKVDVTVTTADADAAKSLNEKIGEQLKQAQDLVGLLVLMEKDLAPIVDIIGDIKHDTKDGAINIKSDIKGETLEKLVKGVKALAEKQGIK
jgi:hypothetical protein